MATLTLQALTQGVGTVGVVYNGSGDATYASSTGSGSVTVLPPFQPTAVACASTSKCTVVSGNGELRSSADGGTTWTSVSSPTTAGMAAVACPTATKCLAVGNGGTALKSTTAGNSWSLVSSGTTQNLRVVKCLTVANCVAAGDAGTVLTSTNDGATWTPRTSGTALNFDGLSCASTTTCLATANNGTTSVVLVSTNSGAAWSVVSASEPATPSGAQDHLSCTSTTTCLYGSTYDIYLTTNGGASWTAETSAYNPTITCPNAATCLATEYGFYLLTSSAGGTSWSFAYEGYASGLGQDITCAGTRCVAVFTVGYNGAQTYTSSNSGSTWAGPVNL